MGSLSKQFSLELWPNGLRVAGSIVIAASILLADILTGAKGLAGVLYVPLLVAIATEARRREVMAFGLLGVAFALIAYLIAKSRAPALVGAWPLGVGLVSAIVTSLLLARLVASREALMETNRKLAYSESRYRSIFEQSQFPFWEQDFSGVFAEFERLRKQGVESLEQHSQKTPDFLRRMSELIIALAANDAMVELLGGKSPEDALGALAKIQPYNETMTPLLQSLYDGGTRLNGRARITTLDGRPKEVWVVSDVLQDGPRASIVVGFLVDLTEQAKARQTLALAQAELARASRVAAVGALSASIAHELNQPLAAVVMNVQTSLRYLRRTPPDITSAIAAGERAAHEGRRASEIVRQTRELVTSRSSREELVDLRALVQEALILLDHDVKDASITVELTSPLERVELCADRVAFQQVFVNLIANAAQAMKEAPRRRLSIALSCEQGDVVVEVRDTGPGIADENLVQLFEPFFTTKEGGVGIGLAISRSAIEARGGTLRAYNAATGGAIFECRIPMVRDGA